jgi:NADPH:quinone reductase-like Zn-dependent oxidoreductase
MYLPVNQWETQMPDMKAVQFDRYGGVDVLEIRRVPRPTPQQGEVLVRVKAAGINPGEAKIREGLLHERWPATFPSGEGSDFAGVVVETGAGVQRFKAGDEVLGFTDMRASHAEFVAVPGDQVTPKPPRVSWEEAGGLSVAGKTAYAAARAVALGAGDVVAVSGAAGGVGAIAVQLASRAGATVLGIAGPSNDAWLTAHGVVAVNYGPDLARRLTAASTSGRIDAFLDFFGPPYLDLAVRELGVDPQRVDTIIDFAGAERLGTQAVGGSAAAGVQPLAELAALIDAGALEVPIAKVYPLDAVREAFEELEKQHTRGKIILRP